MPGLVPGIHGLSTIFEKDVDGRDKPGHDDRKNYCSAIPAVVTTLFSFS